MPTRNDRPRPPSAADSPDRETSIPEFVRSRRRTNRLTQRQLAELAGVGPRAIWDLERGKRTIRMDVVDAVLRVFGKRVGIADARRDVEEPGP